MDFAALTAAVGAGLAEVRACLLVSRDGLALGSYPPGEEHGAMDRWARLSSLGDVERGFAVIGEECWIFSKRGPYSAFAVARASVRPGVILERLDQMVLTVEEARLRKDAVTDQGSRDPGARRRRPSPPPTGAHPQLSPQHSLATERNDMAATRKPASDPVGASGGNPPIPVPKQPADGGQPVPTGEASPYQAGVEGQNPVVPDASPVVVDLSTALGEARSSVREPEAEGPESRRTLWVMDADDLTREFAGLLDDPENPTR